MRSPVIAFGILAAAVGPNVVAGAPTAPNLSKDIEAVAGHQHQGRQLDALGAQNLQTDTMNLLGGAQPASNKKKAIKQDDKEHPTPEDHRKSELAMHNTKPKGNDDDAADIPGVDNGVSRRSLKKRDTLQEFCSYPVNQSDPRCRQFWAGEGGNAYSGAAQDTSGGRVINVSGTNGRVRGGAASSTGNDINNSDAQAGGDGGDGDTGFAFGGDGNGAYGTGGNAYTGSVANSHGGTVVNVANNGDLANNVGGSNTGGVGGSDISGDASGGDALGNHHRHFYRRRALQAQAVTRPKTAKKAKRALAKRAGDNQTAGGNAYTGATGDVDGGNVINVANGQSNDAVGATTDDGDIDNASDNEGGDGGDTYSGFAFAGDGDGIGPGGNAYSGSTGSARGGTVLNKASGDLTNAGAVAGIGGSNEGGDGGNSVSGDAFGGNAGSGHHFYDDFSDSSDSDFVP